MKVLIGGFSTESNAYIAVKNNITDYNISFGDDFLHHFAAADVFEEEGIDLIPSIEAKSGPSGVIEKDAFDYIEGQMLKAVRRHLHEIDGIYLMFHGASQVEEIGSGDHHLAREIRRIVGPYLPIAITCDPHGNLCREYVEESATIIRTCRHSPHIDQEQSSRYVARMLCDLLKNRRNIHAVYRKLPMMFEGEMSVSADEPVKSINLYLDDLEKDPRIMSCSWHVGYTRHDTPVAGCGIVVIPRTEADQEYAGEQAQRLADFIWERRRQFHFTGLAKEPEEALAMTLGQTRGPCVITDSGDNVTSGTCGWNTYILRQVMALPELNKSILFASICDPQALRTLDALEIGDKTSLRLGVGWDEMSEPVNLNVTVKKKGDVINPMGSRDKVIGRCVTVSVEGRPVDIIVSNHRSGYYGEKQFELAGIDWTTYDITVVKLGYIWPELQEKAAFYIMSLTGGATQQKIWEIPYKRILRPMFPIDDI